MHLNYFHHSIIYLPPDIKVGTIKGRRKTVYAVYVHKERRIYALNSEVFYNPFIILHEFYHHLRSRGTGHRGSEKLANCYAKEFLHSYGINRILNAQVHKESIAKMTSSPIDHSTSNYIKTNHVVNAETTKGQSTEMTFTAKYSCQKAFRTMKFHLVYQIQKFQVNDKKDDSESNNRGGSRIIPKDIARYNSISKDQRSK